LESTPCISIFCNFTTSTLNNFILNDYEKNSSANETFNQYFDRKGNNYFFRLLRSHADLSTIAENDFIDWRSDEKYKTTIGVGECAGVQIDLVATLLYEAEEKIEWAKTSLEENLFADSVYHSYSTFVQGAKALLLTKGVHTNSQHSIITEFEKHFILAAEFPFEKDFRELAMSINKSEPTKKFAKYYYNEANEFLKQAKALREDLLKQKTLEVA